MFLGTGIAHFEKAFALSPFDVSGRSLVVYRYGCAEEHKNYDSSLDFIVERKNVVG